MDMRRAERENPLLGSCSNFRSDGFARRIEAIKSIAQLWQFSRHPEHSSSNRAQHAEAQICPKGQAMTLEQFTEMELDHYDRLAGTREEVHHSQEADEPMREEE